VFLPVFKPWDGAELTAAIEAGYRGLGPSWDEGTENKIFRILLDVFRHKKGAGAELPAIKPTVAELLGSPKSLTYHLLAYNPDFPGYGYNDIIEYAHTVPEKNGDTWFADMYRAYDEMPDDLRAKVEGRCAVFSLNHNLVNRCKSRGYHLPLADEDIQPDSLHPVIRTHPVTRKKASFVNWAHTDRIEGYSDEESLALLDRIYEHTTAERYIYRHHYQQGDVIVWDNASTLHTHCPDPPIGDRIMLRVVVAGSEPFYNA